jgi:tetratricopeptide (TPR) repeat protein
VLSAPLPCGEGLGERSEGDVEGKIVLDRTLSVSPAAPVLISVETGTAKPEDLHLALYTEDGRLLLDYLPEKPDIKPIPDPARAARAPHEIASIEQLYLTGLHLEQYRHATYNPLDYYTEALKREPGDIRCNNAVGLWFMRRGQFAQAEPYFRKAIETLTERNPNPYDGEPYYNLGWSLKMQEKPDEAYTAFFKATWNVAWQDAAYLALAQINASNGARDTVHGARWEEALEQVERSLIRNACNQKARQLKASLLRKLGRKEEALQWIEASLQTDRFNFGCLFEKYLLTGDDASLEEIHKRSRGSEYDFLEYALDFAAAGLYEEALEFLTSLTPLPCGEGLGERSSCTFYALQYFASRCKTGRDARPCVSTTTNPDNYFPHRIEEVNILQYAIEKNPLDAQAPYYLGNFWYAHRQYPEAIACWEKSAALDKTFPTVLRNLALAYYNKQNDKEKARQYLEKAFALDASDARILMELDQLYKKIALPPRERLDFLEQHLPLVEQRDDLCIEHITLYNQLGEYEKAQALIDARRFHPWEGGEGKVTGQYVLCRRELAKRAIAERRYETALQLLHETDSYPHNLGEGKLINAGENDIHYYKGIAYRGLGDEEKALSHLTLATQGSSEPQQAFFYNDPQPDGIFYQGLAWRTLGEENKARSCFNKLIAYGEKHLFDQCKIDYFAVSLPDLAIWEDDLNVRNQIHCNYVMGLGHSGLKNREKAGAFFRKVLDLDINHQEAYTHRGEV